MRDQTIPTLIKEKDCLPVYASEEASGADVRAYIEEPILIYPKERKLIKTGLSFAIPKGFEIQVRPRSGLALDHGITVLNSPGTIDSDYRGQLGIILIHFGDKPFTITPFMRIAQIVLAPIVRALFDPREMLKTTQRGAGSFGHTGTH